MNRTYIHTIDIIVTFFRLTPTEQDIIYNTIEEKITYDDLTTLCTLTVDASGITIEAVDHSYLIFLDREVLPEEHLSDAFLRILGTANGFFLNNRIFNLLKRCFNTLYYTNYHHLRVMDKYELIDIIATLPTDSTLQANWQAVVDIDWDPLLNNIADPLPVKSIDLTLIDTVLFCELRVNKRIILTKALTLQGNHSDHEMFAIIMERHI